MNNKDLISTFKLPLYIQGKSFAEASFLINSKFKGRNDMISNNTKNELLKRLADAQEYSKSQEQQVQQEQMAMGGYTNQYNPGGFMQYDTIDPNAGVGYNSNLTTPISPETTDTLSSGFSDASSKTGGKLSAALGAASTAIDLGKTAFGKPTQDTSGLAQSAKVNSGGMIAGSAMKGASAGTIIAPGIGTAIGAAAGLTAGIIGASKAKKAAIENTNNFALNTNRQTSDNYFAMGGQINQFNPGEYPSFLNNFEPEIKKSNFYGPDRIPKPNISSDSTESIIAPEKIIEKPTQTLAEFENYYQNNKSIKPSLGKTIEKYAKVAGKGIKSASKFASENSDLLRYAPAVANAYQLSQLKKPQGVRLDRMDNRYRPDYVDLAQQQNIVNQELNNTNSVIQQSGASQGQSRAAILGAQLNKTRALSSAYAGAQAQNAQQNATTQQFNLGVDQTNLGQSNQEREINDRNIGAYDTQKSQLISQIGNDLGAIGKEQLFKQYPKMMGLGYNWNGKYFINDKGDIKTTDDAEKLENNKAKGGFLNSDVLSHINSMYSKHNSK